jgi:hypothetical protein
LSGTRTTFRFSAYFPGALSKHIVETTYEALRDYNDLLAKDKEVCAERRKNKGDVKLAANAEAMQADDDDDDDEYGSGFNEDEADFEPDSEEQASWERKDMRHPLNNKLRKRFGFRYTLKHLGAWLATGHPHEEPVVSKSFLNPAKSFSRSSRLFEALRPLTYELSILFAAFDSKGWGRARRIMAVLNHFHIHTKACTIGEFDCWSHRAFLFNQETRAHRDVRDDKLGFAALATFGSFIDGFLVIPELKLKFRHQPGDVVIFKGQLLTHFVTPWEPRDTNGERYCVTHFTHQTLVEYLEKEHGIAPKELDKQ